MYFDTGHLKIRKFPERREMRRAETPPHFTLKYRQQLENFQNKKFWTQRNDKKVRRDIYTYTENPRKYRVQFPIKDDAQTLPIKNEYYPSQQLENRES